MNEYTILTTDYPNESVTVRIDSIRVMQGWSDKNKIFVFLLDPRIADELEVVVRFNTLQGKIGSKWNPKVRKTRKGEMIITVPHPVTPENAWE
ncbi:hypothetical protein NB640_09160 [Oxalobacter vibrioformis]|uniref:Uncharacterized protein n=1 Tax=Oxalobacter vibrioformis TaxID=933080 RepID=A0A9E9LXU4_9BURK|nr:hypothetical protein [Oxalobacter vibrioformis]WAW09414.1 hypothetical protein NB640_09160 [Oxalobacter vibrioformis]